MLTSKNSAAVAPEVNLMKFVTRMPLSSMNKAARAGFRTDRRCCQKTKTGVSVAPQKKTFFYQKEFHRRRSIMCEPYFTTREWVPEGSKGGNWYLVSQGFWYCTQVIVCRWNHPPATPGDAIYRSPAGYYRKVTLSIDLSIGSRLYFYPTSVKNITLRINEGDVSDKMVSIFHFNCTFFKIKVWIRLSILFLRKVSVKEALSSRAHSRWIGDDTYLTSSHLEHASLYFRLGHVLVKYFLKQSVPIITKYNHRTQ